MTDTDDQASDVTPQETQVDSTESKETQGSDTQIEGQSEKAEDVEQVNEPKVYDVLGRKMNPDELYTEYRKTQAYITKVQQDSAQREARAKTEAESRIADNELLKNVDPNVREAIIQLVKPEISKMFQEREAESDRRSRDEAFSRRLGELETKYPGKNGLPRFERTNVIAAMQDEGNEIFDPEIKFKEMNREKFEDHLIRQALISKKGGPITESTTGGGERKPEGKSPKTWEDAAKSAFSRF